MTHDVTYGDLYWVPVRRRTVLRDRFEHEQDRTSVWGMHVEHVRPIGDSGWRAGVVFTANRVENPSRPAYDFETVPGNRGRSSAFSVGAGIARSLGSSLFAADVIYEPIWSRIWGVSDGVATAGGSTIEPGSKTVDSRAALLEHDPADGIQPRTRAIERREDPVPGRHAGALHPLHSRSARPCE